MPTRRFVVSAVAIALGSSPGIHGHFVEFKASAEGPNRDAVGGWIELRCGDRVQRRELTIGGGHAGGQLT